MHRIFSQKPQNRQKFHPFATRLSLRPVESRLCLSAASITSLTVQSTGGTNILLSGQISDEHPSSVQVQFSGVASGQVTANSQGAFQFSTSASALGTITAVAVDDENLSSSQVSTQLTSNVPVIASLMAVPTNSGKMVTVSGSVTDESPGNRPVTLTGVVSGTVYTNSNGSFSATLQASGLGTVTATVTDVWGQASTAASAQLTSSVPSFSAFTVTESASGKMVTISGMVNDEAPAGLTVHLSGIVSGTATTSSNGSFSATLQASALGTVSATVTDVWGQTSTAAQYTLTSSVPTITNFSATQVAGQTWIIQGNVSDEFAPGLTVTFGGYLAGLTATVDANGHFSLTRTIPNGVLDTVTAQVADMWGQNSSTVSAVIDTRV